MNQVTAIDDGPFGFLRRSNIPKHVLSPLHWKTKNASATVSRTLNSRHSSRLVARITGS